MARKCNKPVIRIERCFTGERSLTDAFAEAYAFFYEDLEKQAKSSGDTLENSEFTEYNEENVSQEVTEDDKPEPAA